MKSWRVGLLPALLLLSACSQETKPTPETYLLTTVLPSPATPGSEVTVYGRLPAGSQSVNFGDRTVTGTSVRDGIQVTLPADVVAGLTTVTVSGVTGSSVSLDVVPRLDRVTLTGTDVRVEGAGWGGKTENVLIEVNGQRLVPQGRVVLTAPVNPALGDPNGTASDLYGVFNVRVLVGERASETVAVRKEAGTVTGQVMRPLGGQALTVQAVPAPRPPQPSAILLVPLAAEVPAAGLRNTRVLAALGVVRAHYASVEAAQAALQVLSASGLHAEYDAALSVQGEKMMVTGVNALQPQALSPRQWFWPRLGIPEAWTRSQGAGITVAVIDTGVALTHPDLQANLWPGRDYVDGDKTPSDVGGHGTHVSGLIAANGLVSGAAPQAHLLPVRVIGPAGGTTSDLARGLIWAAGLDGTDPNPHPAQVINLSLGTPEYSDVLTQAVKRVLDAGVIVVAANGNDGGLPYSPANIPGVIAVTSMGGPETLYQPSYANRGPGTRIAAYGGDLNADQDRNSEKDGILSTDLDTSGKPGYALRQGTSMAAPQVSGIAALLLSQGTPARTVKALLEGHATDLGVAGMDLNTGWGLVNALTVKTDAPQTYAVALDAQNRVITYTRTSENQFTLHSLPPGQAVQVLAATDVDSDGIVGEAGELRSASSSITVTAGGQATATLTLAPADGTGALPLPK